MTFADSSLVPRQRVKQDLTPKTVPDGAQTYTPACGSRKTDWTRQALMQRVGR